MTILSKELIMYSSMWFKHISKMTILLIFALFLVSFIYAMVADRWDTSLSILLIVAVIILEGGLIYDFNNTIEGKYQYEILIENEDSFKELYENYNIVEEIDTFGYSKIYKAIDK